jgi:hypothetical protein
VGVLFVSNTFWTLPGHALPLLSGSLPAPAKLI